MRVLHIAIFAVVLTQLVVPARGSLLITIEDVGSNVVASASGTIDLTDLTIDAGYTAFDRHHTRRCIHRVGRPFRRCSNRVSPDFRPGVIWDGLGSGDINLVR